MPSLSSVLVIVAIIVIVAVFVGAMALLWPSTMRSRRLRARFGPEYDRTVAQAEDRRAAERELAERERRHAAFALRELPAPRRAHYTTEWASIQEQFVDEPGEAVTNADRLVTALMDERGYPTGDFDQQAADLSVRHATTLGHYRDAHEISLAQARGAATTEDLRSAVVHYRTLFLDLLTGDGQQPGPAESEGAVQRFTTALPGRLAAVSNRVTAAVPRRRADDTARTAATDDTGAAASVSPQQSAGQKGTVA